MQRRSFLTAGLAAAAGALVPLASCARLASTFAGPRLGARRALGPLAPALDDTTGLPLLLLPAGFRYLTFGWTGDPQADGIATPAAHDGMAAFATGPGRTRLVRNHEMRLGGAPRGIDAGLVYDPLMGGGTTSLDFDTASGKLLASHSSIAGTSVNCAGGPTPWGSFAQNNVVLDGQKNGFRGDFRTREFAGAVFSPDGQWLFVNAQSPGITFAITGDWTGSGI